MVVEQSSGSEQPRKRRAVKEDELRRIAAEVSVKISRCLCYSLMFHLSHSRTHVGNLMILKYEACL